MNSDLGLIKRVADGDEEAFSELSKKYDALVNGMVNKFTRESMTYEDVEDLGQEAQMLLLKAARTYDSESGLTFGLYARICMRNGFVSLERKRSRDPKKVDLSEELSVPDTTDYINELESAGALLEKIREGLSEREFDVFKCLTLDMSHKDIAKRFDTTVKSVENTVYRIKKKLGALLL